MSETRLPADFFEADEEGIIRTPDEPGSDGRAQGIELALYVLDPWNQTTGDESRDKRVRALPQDGYPQWLQARYPTLDFDFGADEHATASLYDDYRDDETTEALIGRLSDIPDYVRLRNEGTIFYRLLEAWAEHNGVDIYAPDTDAAG